MEPPFGRGPVGPETGGLSGHADIPIAPEVCEWDTRQLGVGGNSFSVWGVYMKIIG